jgi:hypothetical protein
LVTAAILAASPSGISQEKLPIYLGFFQFVHNTRQRGKALLGDSWPHSLLDTQASTPEPRMSQSRFLGSCRMSDQAAHICLRIK